MRLPRGARPVPGWVGYYVTKDGRVFSERRGAVRELRAPLAGRGYLQVGLTGGKKMLVHRLMLMTFVGPPPTPKHQGRHLDDVKTNNRLSNLAWGTDAENKADAVRNGRHARVCGEQNGRAKLTATQVRQIHELHAAGLTKQQIGTHFGVSRSAVSRVCTGKLWRHRPRTA